mgnify:CR=1 FL=1
MVVVIPRIPRLRQTREATQVQAAKKRVPVRAAQGERVRPGQLAQVEREVRAEAVEWRREGLAAERALVEMAERLVLVERQVMAAWEAQLPARVVWVVMVEW